MPRAPKDVTDAELSVMQVLWKKGPSPIREIVPDLYPEQTSGQYATVQKLLERLGSKGCVERDRGHWPHLFRATVKQSDLIGRGLRAIAERLCGGSLTPLLLHLVQDQPLSEEERASLKALLESAE